MKQALLLVIMIVGLKMASRVIAVGPPQLSSSPAATSHNQITNSQTLIGFIFSFPLTITNLFQTLFQQTIFSSYTSNLAATTTTYQPQTSLAFDLAHEIFTPITDIQTKIASGGSELIYLSQEVIASDRQSQTWEKIIDFCQATTSHNLMVYGVAFSNNTQIPCQLVFDSINKTGSKSYAVWAVSYASNDATRLNKQYYAAMNSSNYTDMKKIADSLIASTGGAAVAYYDLSYAYYKLAQIHQGTSREIADFQTAIIYSRKAIELDPRFAPDHATLANLIFTLESPTELNQEINQLYDQAVKLDPAWSFGLMNRGANLANLGRPVEAYSYYRQAIIANPKFPDQSNIINQYICVCRQLKSVKSSIIENDAFLDYYQIDLLKPIPWCPWK